MERDVAEQILNEFMALSQPLNAATEVATAIDEIDERNAVLRGIGDIMGRVYTDLMIPIIRQYPDLDPDKDQ